MRYALRFRPDPLDSALIQFSTELDFKPTSVGLIVNESYTGSAIIINSTQQVVSGQEVRIQVGKLPVMRARIAWVKILENDLLKLGMEYLE